MDSQKPGQTISPKAENPEVDIQINHSPSDVAEATKTAQPPESRADVAKKSTAKEAEKPAPAYSSSRASGTAEESMPAANWQFKESDSEEPSDSDEARVQKADNIEPISWSASEFIHHAKSARWYLILAAATIILAGLVYLLTRDKISTGVIVFAAIVFGVYANRKPRTLDYKLDNSGLSIGQKLYDYNSFKSFAILHEGAFSSVVLLPLKRFAPLISLYLDPKDEEKVTDALAGRLPLDEHHLDMVDQLMHRIRY